MSASSDLEIERLIPPEIQDDPFARAITRLASQETLRHILEIGSSSGEGSTAAFVAGICRNPQPPTLHCMEVSKARFAALARRYADQPLVKCHNLSSLAPGRFPPEAEVAEFYRAYLAGRSATPLEEMLRWLRQDIEYVASSGVPTDGIQRIKREHDIEHFDAVLIDGSEFTGKAELDEVYGARWILLDDINTFKNHGNFARLARDPRYLLREADHAVRNGYAIFEMIYRDAPASIAHEGAERRLVIQRVRRGMTAIDVGANVGDYTILLSRLVGPGGRVIALEPGGATAQVLQRRLAEHDCTNVEAVEAAAWSKQGQVEFHEFDQEFSAWNSIGKPEMRDPADPSRVVPLRKSRLVPAITLDELCASRGLQRVDLLKVDVEGAEADALKGAVSLLDRKAIRVIVFEISQAMLQGMNRTAQDVFDLLEQKGYECRRIMPDGSAGEIACGSNSFYENYVAFPRLPVHFFTIVLNGQPFIRHHLKQFRKLPFDWHWHIVEGVAQLTHDTAWSLATGGTIPADMHRLGRSIDGTSEYLDQIARENPRRVTVYRKPPGQFWDGKLEMVNQPLGAIAEDGLLWQIDADELWTTQQLIAGRDLFLAHPEKSAALYWCWFFVGANLVTSTRQCYANNPDMEWLRTWRYRVGMQWAAHEPPILAQPTGDGAWRQVGAAGDAFDHHETEKAGLVFQHYAYATEPQVRFKQDYYGYAGAVDRWRALQAASEFPQRLGDYFPWVHDDTLVDQARFFIQRPLAGVPLADIKVYGGIPAAAKRPRVLIDGVFFQYFRTGIARVWQSLLETWAKDGFARQIAVIDRAGTMPRIDGISYLSARPHNYADLASDRALLQRLCDRANADVFISTYYSRPESTPAVMMVHDMIPEISGWDLSDPMWREKHDLIAAARRLVCVSQSTANDLLRQAPALPAQCVSVAPLAAAGAFAPRPPAQVDALCAATRIGRPYFLTVGARGGYKNTTLSFRALAMLPNLERFDILCAGHLSLEDEYRRLIPGKDVRSFHLTDDQLAAAYSGAAALLHPSTYEGFGLPVLEAMACGCPVITTRNGALAEVAGDAALFVPDNDAAAMASAMRDVLKPEIRSRLIEAGLRQASSFNWQQTADAVRAALQAACNG